MNTRPNIGQHFDNDSILCLFLSGDVMSGRGIDQLLPHSVDPKLHEQYVESAREYVALAEEENGAIPDPVSYNYIWGNALQILEEQQPDLRIINLETALTTNDHWLKSKGIHYRMHPANVELLQAADIDCVVLGNNHTFDWGLKGLRESIGTLRKANLSTAGAGLDQQSAAQPAVLSTNRRRVLIFSYPELFTKNFYIFDK